MGQENVEKISIGLSYITPLKLLVLLLLCFDWVHTIRTTANLIAEGVATKKTATLQRKKLQFGPKKVKKVVFRVFRHYFTEHSVILLFCSDRARTQTIAAPFIVEENNRFWARKIWEKVLLFCTRRMWGHYEILAMVNGIQLNLLKFWGNLLLQAIIDWFFGVLSKSLHCFCVWGSHTGRLQVSSFFGRTWMFFSELFFVLKALGQLKIGYKFCWFSCVDFRSERRWLKFKTRRLKMTEPKSTPIV